MTINKTLGEWLEQRGIDIELASRLGLESCKFPGGGEGVKIPYFVGDERVNHKYRQLNPKEHRQDKGATKAFWNFNAICDPSLSSEPLIITEGEWDAITALQCGFQRVVSVPDGAPNQEISEGSDSQKYGYLEHARGALSGLREIILATDGDPNGIVLLNDLAIRLGKARCKWVRYPKGCKDLNETFVRYGEKGVREVFRRAEWCKVDGVYRMSDLPPYEHRKAFDSGFDFLRDHYRVRMGDFTVITGRPGDGKTTFTNDLCCRLADRHHWRIAIASFEQHPQADHRRALREWRMGMPVNLAADREIDAADAWIDEHFVFIVPSDDDLANLGWTLDKCATAAIRHNAKVIVIDPWNELDHDRPPDMSLTEYTGKAIKEFKRLARSLDVHVIVVAHPTKMGAGECPGLYSISDSAHWANKPDAGIVIFKENRESDIAECKVVKSRYWDEIGRPGTKVMRYHALTRRFEEAPEETGAKYSATEAA